MDQNSTRIIYILTRWSKIAAHLPGRTDNEIKNQWNTRIKKRLKLLGLDPVTHKPINGNHEEQVVTVDKKTDDQHEIKHSKLTVTRSSTEQEIDDNVMEEIRRTDDDDVKTQEVLNIDYQVLWGNNLNNVVASGSCSASSFSWEKSNNYNPSSVLSNDQSNSFQQWIDNVNVDSLLSWDYCFNQQEDNLFLHLD